jgi:hypothetical protein
MILSTHGLIASQITQFVGFLDLYPSAAAAYSLRKLRTAYTGSAIEVRRTNLDVADIGFTSTGELDTAALLAFTGTGALDNGFVTKWYDQSGNARDATQSTALNQPQIVSSGSAILDNGKPAALFNGSSDYLITANYNFVATNKIYTAVVANSETNNATRLTFALSDNSTYRSFAASYFQGTGLFAAQFSTNNTAIQTNAFSLYSINQQYLLETLFDTNQASESNRISIYANNNLLSFSTITNNLRGNIFANNKPLSIGADGLGNFRMQGKIQEIIFYSFDQTTNRSGIQTNINDFYSIY